jgi:hypothetical protein
VKGKENPTSEFDLLEIVEVTPVSRSPMRRITRSLPVAIWVPVTPAHNPSFSKNEGPHQWAGLMCGVFLVHLASWQGSQRLTAA